ncbi:MAG: radical SAM protein [Gemmataceae bacterium]|nr:radical SAM protein [Gemmataceae bacterium]MDW8266281.1 radical SAM protein [Gemmataceae bacterium]
MELAVRRGADRFVPPGSYRKLEARLRERSAELAEMPAVVLSCFDRSTRLLPFVLYDQWMFPSGARSVAGALVQAGFARTRAVFQLWNPNFRPSEARIDGRPPELLLLSSMQIHARQAYEAIRDAWRMGPERPLIICGGPKAVYEPYHFWPIKSKQGPIGPDVVCTGEVYVLLDLLNVLLEHRGRGEGLRLAFERARRTGALEDVPGLVYLDPQATLEEPVLVDTGLQRLVQHFDELPPEYLGLTVMEFPHRGTGLSPRPIPEHRVRDYVKFVSVVTTQGCKFNCPYCPIPALNQKTWRYRSPESLVHQYRTLFERFRIKFGFGTDDNFFNHRETAEELLTALARAKTGRHPLGTKIRWGTEATQFDTYKNRDLLPVARAAGLAAIWFGIEDLTAELVNKGQKPEVTLELFRLMHAHKIAPMAMIMFHEGQPFYSRHSLYGLANQVEFLRRAGAISVQCTVHTPAVGTREYEKTYHTGRVIRAVGKYVIPEAKIDGNHVTVAGKEPAWQRQLKLLGGYATFYNPLNLLRALKRDGSPLWKMRLGYQAAGLVATLWTAVRTLPYVIRLWKGPLQLHAGPPPMQTVPVRRPTHAFPRLPASALRELEAADHSQPVPSPLRAA